MSLGLLGAYISSSSSSSEEESEEELVEEEKKVVVENLANPFSDKKTLPKPSYMVEIEDYKQEKVVKNVTENSVFSNPFRAREERKKAVLERHVEMTTKQEDQRMIGGKKVCWNFRKGRCRFGSKCTFAHDSDVAASSKEETNEQDTSNDVVAVAKNMNAKKKRPGLSDNLVPGKKAMKFHNQVYNE